MSIKQIFLASVPLFFVLSLFFAFSGMIVLPVLAEDVIVTAAVDEWLTFSVNPTTLDLGTLVNSSGGLSIGSATTGLSLASNSDDGFSISVSGTNAGLKNGAVHTILTPEAGATTTCDISGNGTDAYGAQVTSTDMTAQSPFNVTGNVVGSVTSTGQLLLSSGYTTDTLTAVMTVKASASKYDASGAYTDTLVLTAAANP